VLEIFSIIQAGFLPFGGKDLEIERHFIGPVQHNLLRETVEVEASQSTFLNSQLYLTCVYN
jgi:hypothetical protein